jgi:hypothetical protein
MLLPSYLTVPPKADQEPGSGEAVGAVLVDVRAHMDA